MISDADASADARRAFLEINRACAYFAFANRLLNGLGVSLDGGVAGFYESPAEAEHQGWKALP